MSHLQPRTISGNVWPPVVPGEVSQPWAMYLELERTQWLGRPELEARQLSQARLLLTHCVEHVPYYVALLREANVAPQDIQSLADFRRLPILQRAVYQARFSEFCSSSLPRGQVQSSRQRTSGTSGMPIEVWQTNLVQLWWFAFFLRDYTWSGFDMRGSLAAIRSIPATTEPERMQLMQGVALNCWSEDLNLVVENGPSYAMDIHQDPRRQLEWLRRVQPNYLISYPPNLEFLAGLLQEAGDRLPGLRAIQTVGETLTPEARTRIEVGFGVPVKDTYSCVEAGYLASPCPEGHGLHVHAENVLLEVLDEAGNPCAPGETGRVVLTALHNFLTPFIRYEILDGATAGPAECPCGRGLPLLTRVHGKHRPQFRLPDGRRKDSGFLVRELRRLGGYHQHQVIQRKVDHVTIRIVPDRTWSPAHAERLRQSVQVYLEAPVTVEVECVERIAITPAGKFQEMICEVE